MSPTRAFPNSPASVARARAFVRRSAADLAPEVADEVELMVSELATNAVRHTRAGFEVRVDRDGDRLRIAVADEGDGAPTVKNPEPRSLSGRGLWIVEQLAHDWGIEASGGGKAVWFTVALGERTGAAAP